MLAVLGVKIDEVKSILEKRKDEAGICEIANDNADGQVILSGTKENIFLIKDIFKEKKLNQYLLKSAHPFTVL